MLQYQVATIPNKKSFNSPDYTPLHIQEACRLGDMQEILKALDLDPDSINCRDQNVIYTQLGWTPLYRSVVSGDLQATQLLLSHGADPNIVNHLGETPLHQAADYSQYAIAKSLLDAGADPDIQQDQGDTPLHHAAFKGDSQMISLLLEYGADPNTKNYMFGRTPVHYAVDYGHIECAEIIVKSGGDIYLPDRQGKSPLDLAHDLNIKQALESLDTDEITVISKGSRDSIHDHSDSIFGVIDSHSEYSRLPSFSPTKPDDSVEPDAEKSVIRGQKDPLLEWLERQGLQHVYSILIESGYDDLDSMINQMRSSLPITAEALKDIGIAKAGHRYRLIIKLEEEAGIVARPPIFKSRPSFEPDKESFWRCCTVPNNATFGVVNSPSLREWLRCMKLESLHESLVEAGYDEYDQLVTQMYSRYPLNDNILEHELKISKPGHRNRILAKLQEECRIQKRESLLLESFDKGASCQLCSIF